MLGKKIIYELNMHNKPDIFLISSPNFSMDYIFSIKPSNIQNKSNISSSPHDHVPVSTKQEQKLQQEIVNTPLFLNLVVLNLNKPICCQEQAPVKVRNLETDV